MSLSPVLGRCVEEPAEASLSQVIILSPSMARAQLFLALPTSPVSAPSPLAPP